MTVTGNNPSDNNRSRFQPGSERDAGEVTREMAVGPLLARANLLRMRGQWDEAIAVCTEALRQAPKSPTAHSVLGDIYEAQGKLDDALQWYGMAVELAPGRTADREKLERVVAIQRGRFRDLDKERVESMKAHRAQMAGKLRPADNAPATGTGGRAAERTVEWFDRVFPPGRSESIARLIFALCGIIALLIASAAFFVYTSSRTRITTTIVAEGGPTMGLPTISEPSPPVTILVPKGRTETERNSPAAKSAQSAGIAGTPRVTATNAPTLLGQLTQSLPPGVTVTNLRGEGSASNPYHLEIALPKSDTESQTSTQERVLRGASISARNLALLDSRSTQIIVRALLRENVMAANGGFTSRGPAEIPVFQGSIASAAIRATDPALTPSAVLQSQFTGVTWAAVPESPINEPNSTPTPASNPTPSSPIVAPSEPTPP